jgi:hypothetical protein
MAKKKGEIDRMQELDKKERERGKMKLTGLLHVLLK